MNISNRFKAFAFLCGASAITIAAQAQQPAPVAAQPGATPVQAPAVAEPATLPAPIWAPQDAQELLAFIQNVGAEGLDPRDYDAPGLIAALASRNPMAISTAASERFVRLADDLALGHVRGKDRIGWSIEDPDLGAKRKDQPLRPDQLVRLDQIMRTAIAQHNVTATLTSLLPQHPQYGMLKKALAITPAAETSKINRIRLNLDRWRWLPRDLGDRYIIANVPAYTAALVENGDTISRHYAVAGKVSTPTPQLSAVATGVILNPWWEVPKSIEPEVRGKAGYVPVKGKDGKVQRWRQPPGPGNALGKLKFVMWNPQAIYLHDTNAKSKFNSRVRAFSHGCIRTDKIIDLATILLTEGGTEWTPEKVQATLASGKSVQANFPKPLPVYIIYMSSAATVDGRIIDYPDIYKRDSKAITALLDTTPGGATTRTAVK